MAATRPGSPTARRLTDDVVTIELRAVAGLTYPLVDHLHARRAAGRHRRRHARHRAFLDAFPYLGFPYAGYYVLAFVAALPLGARRSAAPNGVAPGTSPVLDIGGDVGAMIVYLDGTPSGEIVAIPPAVPRSTSHRGAPAGQGGRTVHVALFPEVVAGGYDLLDPDGEPLARIGVTGGAGQRTRPAQARSPRQTAREQ